MFFKLVCPRVAYHSTGFAGVTAGDHGAIFKRVDQFFFVAINAACFMCGNKACAHPHAVGAKCKRCCKSATIKQTTCSNDHHFFANSINYLWHECHGGNGAGVSATFGALGNNKVATAFVCRRCVTNFSAHRTNEHTVLVQLVNNVAWYAEACNKHACTTLNNQVNIAFKRVGKCGQQVNAKSLVGQLLYTINFGF